MSDRVFRFLVVGLLAVIAAVLALAFIPGLLSREQAAVEQSPITVVREFWEGTAAGDRVRVAKTLDPTWQTGAFLLDELPEIPRPMFTMQRLTLIGDVVESGPVAVVTVEICRYGIANASNDLTRYTLELHRNAEDWRIVGSTLVSTETVVTC